MADELLPPVEAKLTANTSEFRDDMQKAQGVMNDTERVGSGAFGKLAKGIGLGLLAGTAAVATFAASSIAKFGEVAGSIDGLMDITGESADQMSRTRYAFTSWGVDADQLEKGMLKLSKAVGSNKDVFDQYGIKIRDAQGNLLPMSDVLANAADVFAGMPDGIEKNNLAMDLFGKSGTELIDVLNGGSGALKDLGDEAERFGLVLGDEDVAAAEKNAKSKRQLAAAWEGLQIQLGKHLVPILATASGWLADKIPLAVAAFRRGLDIVMPVVQRVADWLGQMLPRAIGVAVTAWGWITDGFQWLIDHQPVLIGVAVAIGVGLVALFASWAAGAITAAAATIAATAPILAIGLAVAAAVAGVIYAYEHWEWFRNTVDTVARFLRDTVWPVLQSVFGWLRDNVPEIIQAVVDWFQKMWDKSENIRTLLSTGFKIALDVAKGAIDLVWGALQTAGTWLQTAWDKSEALRSLLATGFKLAWDLVLGAIDLVWGALDTLAGWLQTAWEKSDTLRGLLAGAFKLAVDGIGTAFGLVVGPISTVVGWINTVITKAETAIKKVAELVRGQALFDGVSWGSLGAAAGVSVPSGNGSAVPMMARGGRTWESGIAIVGEEGPEVVELPRGATVYPTGTGPASSTQPPSLHVEQHFHGITDHTALAVTGAAELAWLMKTGIA